MYVSGADRGRAIIRATSCATVVSVRSNGKPRCICDRRLVYAQLQTLICNATFLAEAAGEH